MPGPEIDDDAADGAGSWGIAGIIEGFYGTPWTWAERVEVMQWCAQRGMTHYVYAPKDDPKHRLRWRELYGPKKLDGFSRLLADGGLTVGFAISPGLDIDPRRAEDRAALRVKVDQVVDLGVPLVVLALDDIPFDPGAGTGHAELAAHLADHLAGRAEVVLVPTEYVGTARSRYLDDLAGALPDGIPVAWTGAAVVNDSITAAEARARAEAVGGRPPLLWDNYPVNDGHMDDRLFMGPLWGRDPGLAAVCSGYLANPMVQARSSKLPLASVAAFLRGDDPLSAWAAEAGGLRALAEACDGAVPQALAQAFVAESDGPGWARAAAPLAGWLAEAAACTAPGLEGEADEWVHQTHREATLGLSALRLLQAARPWVEVQPDGSGRVVPPDPDAVLAEAYVVSTRWPRVRRGGRTVMGVRCGFRPVLRQRGDGAWRMARASVEEGANAVDAVVRAALDVLDAVPDDVPPVEVLVDGEPVAVAEDGTFTVKPGADVVAVCGEARTHQTAPATRPVPAA